MKNQTIKARSAQRRRFLPAALLTFAIAAQPGEAATYYFDNDSASPGFGTAGGTWAAPTSGPIPGWSTDSTGASTPGSVTTTLSDWLNFGSEAAGLGAGTITLEGALSASNMTFAAGSGHITLTGGSLALPATAVISVNNSADTIASPLAGAATSLAKEGPGTLLLSGPNAVAGAVAINRGELQLNSGSLNLGNNAVSIASGSGRTAVLHILNGNFTNAATSTVGSGTDNAVGIIKINGGNFVKTAGNLNLSGGAAGRANYSALLMSEGYAAVAGEFNMTYNSLDAASYIQLTGGLLVTSNYCTVGREGSGTLDIAGGTFFRPATAANKFYMNRSAGSFSQLAIRNGGVLEIEDSFGLAFANSANNAGSGVVNLLSGGLLISRAGVIWNGKGITYGYFNFNGGVLRASGGSARFWTNSWTACYVFAGGATIDSQANDLTIDQPLLAPSGNGVTSIAGGAGEGYLAPPVVQLLGGGGTGASAIAQLDPIGVITNILVTNPGVDYTSAPTVALLGGGGVAHGWTAVIGPNTAAGGFAKLGSGTLRLTGYNTYQGPTAIAAGTLAITAGNHPATSALAIADHAALKVDVSGGATLATPAVTLGANSSITLDYGSLGSNPFQPAISDASINTGAALETAGSDVILHFSGSGFTAGQFPVIKYSGAIAGAGFSAFKLGTRPGIMAAAKLVNNTANQSIDVLIPAVNSLTWSGATANWDINTSYNWRDASWQPARYAEYGGANPYGDDVTFDDGLADPSQTNINLTTTLSPTTVTLAAQSTPYSFSGPGRISGAAAVNVTGFAPVKFSSANDYSGGTVLSAGTVLVGHDSALGIGPIDLAGGILSADGPAARRLENAVVISADSTLGTAGNSGELTISGPVDFSGGSPALTVNNRTVLTGPASNGGVGKWGPGQLIFDNPATSLDGDSTVFDGAVVLGRGVFTGNVTVAPSFNQTGVLEILEGNFTNSAALPVAYGASALGLIRQSGGNFIQSGAVGFGNLASGSAAFVLSGGLAYFGGDTKLDNNGAVGLLSQSGGTMVSVNFFTIARDGGLGVYDLSGGLHYRPASAAQPFYLGTRADGGNAQVTIRGSGILQIEDSFGLWFDRAGDRTKLMTGTINLLRGGTLINRSGFNWGASNPASAGYVNFNGGTLRASGSSTNYWSGWTAARIFSGGATIDSQENDISIDQALLAPVGNGVVSISGGGGSGYLFPPVVTLSGDGAGAAAIAQIDGAGNLTNILVTSPGVGYSAAPWVTLSGGGGDGSGWTAAIGPNSTSGGLVKLGTGTLRLNGANTYQGVTLVSQGTLAGTGAYAGPISIEGGATLSPGSPIGSLTINNNLSFATNASAVFEVNKDDLTQDAVHGIVNIAYAGTLIVTNAGGSAFNGGETFQLFSASGAKTGTFDTITILPATGATGSFDPQTGTVTIHATTIPSSRTNITAIFSGGNLTLSWPESYLGWLAQSNAVNVAAPESWFDIPGSASATSLVITPEPGRSGVFYRLRHPRGE